MLPHESPNVQCSASNNLVQVDKPMKIFSHFQYLGSFIENDCGMDTMVNSKIFMSLLSFHSARFMDPEKDSDSE